MKRIGFVLTLGLLILMSTGFGARTYFKWARPDGVNTVSGHILYCVQDSTDTFFVDTFSSDTLTIDTGSTWLNWNALMTGFTICDSCNDSVVIVMQLYGSYGPNMKRLLATDTFPTTLGSLDSASDSVLSHNIKIDTVGVTRAWIDMVIKDSCIIGNSTVESLRVETHHELLAH